MNDDWQQKHFRRIIESLSAWRNRDHSDNVTLCRSDICTILDCIAALQKGATNA